MLTRYCISGYKANLAKIDSLSGILSPGVLISFAVLGLFPITVKKLLALYKRRFRAPTVIEAEPANTRRALCDGASCMRG